jgi:hypothetical protein
MPKEWRSPNDKMISSALAFRICHWGFFSHSDSGLKVFTWELAITVSLRPGIFQ